VQPISFGFSAPPQLFDILLVLVIALSLLSFCPERNKRLIALAFGVPIGVLSLGGHLFPGGRTSDRCGSPAACKTLCPNVAFTNHGETTLGAGFFTSPRRIMKKQGGRSGVQQ